MYVQNTWTLPALIVLSLILLLQLLFFLCSFVFICKCVQGLCLFASVFEIGVAIPVYLQVVWWFVKRYL